MTTIIVFEFTRIVGGKAAVRWSLPWMAHLLINCDSAGRCSACGGSLISDRHILTAAHCFSTDKEYVFLKNWLEFIFLQEKINANRNRCTNSENNRSFG